MYSPPPGPVESPPPGPVLRPPPGPVESPPPGPVLRPPPGPVESPPPGPVLRPPPGPVESPPPGPVDRPPPGLVLRPPPGLVLRPPPGLVERSRGQPLFFAMIGTVSGWTDTFSSTRIGNRRVARNTAATWIPTGSEREDSINGRFSLANPWISPRRVRIRISRDLGVSRLQPVDNIARRSSSPGMTVSAHRMISTESSHRGRMAAPSRSSCGGPPAECTPMRSPGTVPVVLQCSEIVVTSAYYPATSTTAQVRRRSLIASP